MGKIWEVKKEEEGGDRQLLLWQEIQQSFRTTQAVVVWVGVCVCSCMHMCVLGLGAGRQAQRNICSGPQGWPRARMCA